MVPGNSRQPLQVRLCVQSGRLEQLELMGTFLAEPDRAAASIRAAITKALEQIPADLPLKAIEAHIQAAIPFGVALLVPSAQEIATAIHVALRDRLNRPSSTGQDRIGSFSIADWVELTRKWSGVPWTVLPEQPLSAAVNVACDEVLADQVSAQVRGPTLRLWRWTESAVIIGRTQSLANEVDLAALQYRNMRVVRRLTGGGAMVVQPHGAITYSLYLPEQLVHGLTIRQSYEVCDAWVILGLRELGCEAYYVPINDIACSEGKIGGAAQARRKGVVLHHTTLAYDLDPGEMAQVLRIGREKLRDKGTASAAKRVSPLVRQTNQPREEIVSRLLDSFQRRFGGAVGALSSDDLQAAERLARDKYQTPGWTAEFD